MADGREYLPEGTRLELVEGHIYTIIGEPVGSGGGSVIYPARRLIRKGAELEPDGFLYALKECYPVSAGHFYRRDDRGQIVPGTDTEEGWMYLTRARQLQQQEGLVSRDIYKTASRVLPIRETSESVLLTLPGKDGEWVSNTVTVMESLSEKGRSLSSWLREYRRFQPLEALRILQQLLFALEEVHRAGYLHLDIQDGNVFLRGALEDRSELVTLIDFGSARAMDQGKTAPIEDRVIFTTQGFSAPEILKRNDGTLRLGPEADLYSVGCLALYLLTGQRPDSRLLLANSTGLYLKPNQLRRMKCPAHLVGKLQQFLGRALKQAPEERYHSAEEMLADVTQLVDALRPYRADLASVTYDAFVCYKHGDVDSEAALTLQRALENYRAPRGVAESRKPFRRVFVDEGELSSCADFGQQIREALKNAGWLIVICSEDTPLSPWVQLEIETFLEYHDRSRILAVLTGGNEKISFPPQLRQGGEVLAADARGESTREIMKNLRGNALLKLAAPMLGTTFDTLKQRQKLYRMQKIAGVTAGALALTAGFAAYAVNRAGVIADQAKRIEEEYHNALVNESRFLVEQAEKRLEDNDPLGAMELALAALPSEEQDRPVLPEAEYVLGRALDIYTTPSQKENTATAVGLIRTENPYFFLDQGGKILFSWDDDLLDGMLRAWRTEDLSVLWEYTPGYNLSGEPILTERGHLLFSGYNSLACVDAADGTELWRREISDLVSVAASGDGKTLLVISGEQGDFYGSDADRETPHELTAALLDGDSGKTVETTSFRVDGSRYLQRDICVSENLKWAALITVAEGSGTELQTCNALHLLNRETGEVRTLLDSDSAIGQLCFDGDSLAVFRCKGISLTTVYNISYDYREPCGWWMERYDLSSGSCLWSTEGNGYLDSGEASDIAVMDYDTGSERGKGILFAYYDHCTLLDRETGSRIRDYRLPAALMLVRTRDNWLQTLNTDGSCTIVDFTSDTTLNIGIFEDTVSEAHWIGDWFYIQNTTLQNRDHTIHQYQVNRSDTSYEAHFSGDSQSWRTWGFRNSPEGWMAVLVSDGDSRICAANLDTGESRIHRIPEQYGFESYNVLGLSEDGHRLYWYQYGEWEDPDCWIESKHYFCMDLLSGEITWLKQPEKPREWLYVDELLMDGDRFVFTGSWNEELRNYQSVYLWDARTDQLQEIVCWELESGREETDEGTGFWWEALQHQSFEADLTAKELSFATYDSRTDRLWRLMRVNWETGESRCTELNAELQPDPDQYGTWRRGRGVWNREGSQILVGVADTLWCIGDDGRVQYQIPMEAELAAVWYSPEETHLMTVTEAGLLSKYRASDGVPVSRLDLKDHCEDFVSIYDDWALYYPDGETMLAVTADGGFLLDIAGDGLNMKAVADQCVGYDTDRNRILIEEKYAYSGKNTTIGSFRYYTTEDLIQMAKTILNP